MLKNRRIPPHQVVLFALPSTLKALVWTTIVFCVYAFAGWEFLRIPFQPLATMGVAVAFYVGFKNNASYDRFWEGRKIWGGVVNSSRTWGTQVVSYIRPGDDSEEARELRRVLIYRHIAWINALRLQLRKTSRFFDKPARSTKRRLDKHEEHMRNDWDQEIGPFLSPDEMIDLSARLNSATHIVTRQGTHLAEQLKEGKLDLFHQIAMMNLLEELYTLQGKCERIKNTQFPRLYAEYSRIFTKVFVALIPFGLLDVFSENVDAALTARDQAVFLLPMLASSMLIAWVFETMESIGDASEDPFERSMNDVPMNALCRTIERDLRQMLGEPDELLPPGETVTDGIIY